MVNNKKKCKIIYCRNTWREGEGGEQQIIQLNINLCCSDFFLLSFFKYYKQRCYFIDISVEEEVEEEWRRRWSRRGGGKNQR